MTGHQDNPTTGYTIRKEETKQVNLITLCKSIGIEPVSYTHLDVYKRQGLRHSTIIGLLKRMEKNNFVRVEVNPEDHRCRQVILLDKAFELGREMKEHRKYMDCLLYTSRQTYNFI